MEITPDRAIVFNLFLDSEVEIRLKIKEDFRTDKII